MRMSLEAANKQLAALEASVQAEKQQHADTDAQLRAEREQTDQHWRRLA